MRNAVSPRLDRRILACWAFTLGWLYPVPALALDPGLLISQYATDNWGIQNGLISTKVHAFAQTPDGYLWLGTPAGVARFDGVRFVKLAPQNAPELTAAYVRALCVSRDGTLWMGTDDGRIGRYKEGRFQWLRTSGKRPYFVRALHADGQGNLLVGGGNGLLRIAMATGVVSVTDIGTTVYAIDSAADGALWVGTHYALYRFDGQRTTHTFAKAQGLPSILVRSVGVQGNTVWAGTEAGLVAVDITRMRVSPGPATIPPVCIEAILSGSDGSAWIATEGHGVFRLRGGLTEHRTFSEDGDRKQAIKLFEDREGSVWLGMLEHGLTRLCDVAVARQTRVQGLFSNFVGVLLASKDGCVWAGASDVGLQRWCGARWERIGFGRQKFKVNSLAETADGQMWGTVWSERGHHLVRCEGNRLHEAAWPAAIDGPRGVIAARQGGLWVATESALYRREPSGTLHPFAFVHSKLVNLLGEDSLGVVWADTTSGLSYLENGRWKRPRWAEGKRAQVWSMAESPSGVKWFGTLGNGVIRVAASQGRYLDTSTSDIENFAAAVQLDAQGRLWILGRAGLYAPAGLDEQPLNGPAHSRVFTTLDGMPSTSTIAGMPGARVPLSCLAKDGTLWFTTLSGLAVVNPARLRPNLVPPPVVVEAVEVDGQPLTLPNGTARPGRGNVSIQFTANSLQAPKRVRFRYKLEGWDRDWREGAERSVQYTNLPPARYRFVVTASNNDGVWARQGGVVEFALEPHWYQTPPAGSAGTAMALLAVLLLLRWRTARLRRHNTQLEEAVAARTVELMRAREAAEAAARAKAEFLANMSHEIRTPLNGLLGMTLLAMEEDVSDEARQCLGTARISGEILLGVVNDILDFSKIESGRLTIEQTAFRVRALAGDVIAVLRLGFERKGVALRLVVADDVPAGALGDPTRLRQVLLNLLGNALKFTPAGTVKLELKRGAGPCAPGRWQLEGVVTDTGIGIPPDRLPLIFEAFRQADSSTTREYGGTGLGLAITRSLVEAMGGHISATSEVGQGTQFRFTVLLGASAEEAAEEDKVETPATPMPGATLPTRALRILLAEDNPVNRKVACRVLEKAGHTVLAVENGQEAVEAVAAHTFDAVLMDVQMPRMDGLEATRAIRAMAGACANVPIVALTACVLESDTRRCREAGMNGFLGKPFEPAVLMQTVAELAARGSVEVRPPSDLT